MNTTTPRLAFELTMNGEKVLGQNLILDCSGTDAAALITERLLGAWAPVLAKAIFKEMNDA